MQDFYYKNNNITDKYTSNNSAGGSLGLGYEFNKNFALELAVSYQPNHQFTYKSAGGLEDKQELSLVVPMVKAYYNYYFSDNMKIYIGAGVGMSFVNLEHKMTSVEGTSPNNKTIDTSSIAGAGYIGFGKKVGDVAFDLGYSYGYYGQSSDDENKKYAPPLDIFSHSVILGIKFYF